MSGDLKAHVHDLLTERQAHVQLGDVLDGFPTQRINEDMGLPYTAWGLLWHVWFTQRDILNFVRDEPYTELEWPADYWPKSAGTPESWAQTVQAFRDDLAAFLDLFDKADPLAIVPNGVGSGEQTWLREALLIADHNAYHLGQLVMARRMLEREDG